MLKKLQDICENINIVKKIIEARDRIIEVKKAKCSCSSFVLQVEGCGCGKKSSIEEAEASFWSIVNTLK